MEPASGSELRGPPDFHSAGTGRSVGRRWRPLQAVDHVAGARDRLASQGSYGTNDHDGDLRQRHRIRRLLHFAGNFIPLAASGRGWTALERSPDYANKKAQGWMRGNRNGRSTCRRPTPGLSVQDLLRELVRDRLESGVDLPAQNYDSADDNRRN